MRTILITGIMLLVATVAHAANEGLSKGTVQLKSGGPLAFGPDGVLFVGDPEAAAIYAIATGETSGDPGKTKLNVEGIDKKIAGALGTSPQEILVNDLAINPHSGSAYLSVSRGRGPDAANVLLRVDGSGEISELSLKNVSHAKAEIPNAPAPGGEGRRNKRSQSITDIEFVDGRLLVAGLSNEEFESTLRSIPYPFNDVAKGTGVRIFHGAHGRFETDSPVRTFATYQLGGESHVLAAYTCTPLVRFSLNELQPGKQVNAVTVAELGNRNRPLDMVVYNQGGKDYILMANSSRGMMKIRTDGIERNEGIEERVSGTAGQGYDTIESLQGVVQMDRLNDSSVAVLQQNEDGALHLKTVALP